MNTKIVIAGDFCPQNRVADLVNKGSFNELYNSVRPVIESADYSIVNFECPIAGNNAQPIVKCGPLLKCSPKSIQAIKYCGFKAVTLANNHFRDYGDVGVLNSINIFKDEGIDYMGGGKNLSEASEIFYKEINGEMFAFINCCENEFSIASESRPGSNPLSIPSQCRAIKVANSKAKYVIVIIQGGLEGCQYPSPRMMDTYRFFIETGADAVINHHQHCYSGYEYYLGKPICYGLGNFSFCKRDISTKRTSWNEGLIAQLSFNDDGNIVFDAFPYIQGYDNPGTILMQGQDKLEFEKQFEIISEDIKGTVQAEVKYNNWVDTHSDWYRIIFEPWGRGLRILRRKGWLPSLVSKKKWLSLADYMICETHNDCIKRYFYTLIDKYNNE